MPTYTRSTVRSKADDKSYFCKRFSGPVDGKPPQPLQSQGAIVPPCTAWSNKPRGTIVIFFFRAGPVFVEQEVDVTAFFGVSLDADGIKFALKGLGDERD
jgi:hypothetical protein